jgi:hypothetical protein
MARDPGRRRAVLLIAGTFLVAMAERTSRYSVPPVARSVQLVVIGAFCVATVATITRIPQVFRAAKPEPASAGKRELAPATVYHLDARLLTSAARDIPRQATYAVVSGNGVRSRFVRVAEKTLLAYWLLPRRLTGVHSGQWIVSIGGDLRSVGLRYTRVVRVDRGAELAEVKR